MGRELNPHEFIREWGLTVVLLPLVHSEGAGDAETFRLPHTGGLQTREKGQLKIQCRSDVCLGVQLFVDLQFHSSSCEG